MSRRKFPNLSNAHRSGYAHSIIASIGAIQLYLFIFFNLFFAMQFFYLFILIIEISFF